jgi:hypothetical protein
MKDILDLFFAPRGGNGTDEMASYVHSLLQGTFLTVEAYLSRVPRSYISLPLMFITEVEDTTIAEGNALRASRMESWCQSPYRRLVSWRTHAKYLIEARFAHGFFQDHWILLLR